MGYAHDVLSLVLDELDGVDTMGFSVTDNKDGTSTVKGRFRVKPRKKGAGAMDADIEPLKVKPTVKAKFSECKSKNPMRCRYHGALYAQNAFKAILTKHGVSPENVEVKRIDKGTYDFSVKVPDEAMKAVFADMKAFMAKHELEPFPVEKNGEYYTMMYDTEEELDPDEVEAVNALKEDAKNASESIGELEGIRADLSADDASELNAEIENQRARSADMNETIEMLGANEEFDGWDDGDGSDVDFVLPSETLPTLPQLPKSLDELTPVEAELGGSTGPTLWEDKDGNRFVMKTGGTAGGDPEAHVTNEYNGLKAYRALGVFAPDAKLYKDKDGKTVMVENFVEGTPLGQYLDTCSSAEYANIIGQIKDTTYADVLLGNWDAAGTFDATAGEYPNMMVVDGRLCRIDPGGWGRFRAQGAPKNREDWEDGYPNELFTMRQFGTSKDFIQDVTPYDLATQIASKDLVGLIDALPDDDKEVMQKRIRECRELAETGKNYVEDGKYTKDFASDVMEFSLELAKRGGREALDYGEIKCEYLNAYTMKYGANNYVASNKGEKSLSAQIAALKKRIYDLSAGRALNMNEARLSILSAVKSINHHANNGGEINMEKLDKALSFEKDLETARQQIDEGGGGLDTMYTQIIVDDCLKWLGKVKEVKESGKLANLGDWKFDPSDSLENIKLQPTEEGMKEAVGLRKDLKKLLDEQSALGDSGKSEFAGMNPMQIIDELLTTDNIKTGLDAHYKDVQDAMRDQGYNTWKQDDVFSTAHLMKLAEGMAMGIDYTEKPKYDHSDTTYEGGIGFYTPQMQITKDGSLAYCGTLCASKVNVKNGTYYANIGESELRTDGSSGYTYNETVRNLKKDPKRMQTFYRAFAAMKAVQSMIFASTKFQHADRNFVMVKRELQQQIVNTYGLEVGKYNVFPCGFSDSASYGVSSFDDGYGVASLTRCPVSRLTGLCCWDDPFAHNTEGEFGVNLVGLPQYLVQSSDIDTKDNDHRYDLYNEYSQKNPKPTSSNTFTYKAKNLT